MKIACTSAQESRQRLIEELRASVHLHLLDLNPVLFLQAANEIEALAEDKARAVYIAEHLFEMVPREVWRDAGGDDGQGHYEGYYWAETTRKELEELK
jgi:hypothetical protein